MKVDSQQLGHIEIPEEATVSFPQGLPGFPQARRFCLVEPKPNSRFKLLQCTHQPNLAFIVTDPLGIDPSYPLPTVQSLAAHSGLEPDEPLAVAVIVTVPPAPRKMTANLMAPIAMGMRSRIGTQVILHDGPYQLRYEL